jgi:hypothetical protein
MLEESFFLQKEEEHVKEAKKFLKGLGDVEIKKTDFFETCKLARGVFGLIEHEQITIYNTSIRHQKIFYFKKTGLYLVVIDK